MSEIQNQDKTPSSPPTPALRPRKKASVPIILALAALGISGWQYYTIQLETGALRQTIAEQREGPTIKLLTEQLQMTQGKLALLESRLNASSAQFSTLNSMYQDMTRVRSDWLLSEVAHALALASQELQLTGNVTVAISALQSVYARLAQFDRPELIGVKKAVTIDLESLKAIPPLDTVGLSAKIDTMSHAVDSLPLSVNIQRQAVPPMQQVVNDPAWRRLLKELTHSLGEMIRIRRIDKPEAILLTPEQSFQLRENLKLHLIDARIALLQRDAAPFNADMEALQTYVDRYFDLNVPATRQWLSMLSTIKTAPVGANLPELSASLKAVNSAQAVLAGAKP